MPPSRLRGNSCPEDCCALQTGRLTVLRLWTLLNEESWAPTGPVHHGPCRAPSAVGSRQTSYWTRWPVARRSLSRAGRDGHRPLIQREGYDALDVALPGGYSSVPARPRVG